MAHVLRSVLALAVWLTSNQARAEAKPEGTPPAEASGGSEARSARARVLFRTGLGAARAGSWDEARVAFEAAYNAAQSPAVLFNLAGAQRRTGRLLASHANYRRYAKLKSTDVSADQRRLADQLADEVEASIPRLRLVIDGLTTRDRVILDRQRIYGDELGRDLWLDPGQHTLQVERPSGDSEQRTLTLREREVRVLSMRVP